MLQTSAQKVLKHRGRNVISRTDIPQLVELAAYPEVIRNHSGLITPPEVTKARDFHREKNINFRAAEQAEKNFETEVRERLPNLESRLSNHPDLQKLEKLRRKTRKTKAEKDDALKALTETRNIWQYNQHVIRKELQEEIGNLIADVLKKHVAPVISISLSIQKYSRNRGPFRVEIKSYRFVDQAQNQKYLLTQACELMKLFEPDLSEPEDFSFPALPPYTRDLKKVMSAWNHAENNLIDAEEKLEEHIQYLKEQAGQSLVQQDQKYLTLFSRVKELEILSLSLKDQTRNRYYSWNTYKVTPVIKEFASQFRDGIKVAREIITVLIDIEYALLKIAEKAGAITVKDGNLIYVLSALRESLK